MQSRTIDVPKEIPKRSVMQYVYAEAQKLEKRFRCGMDEDDRTTFEQYAESWLKRQTHYKPSTLAGYQRELKIVYPFIGGIALNKLRPLILEEMCAELRKRKKRNGEPVCEATVRKYLQTVSAVLEDAKRNDILLYNPAHRVRGIRVERKVQPIPSEFEMRKLLQCILQEPLLYRVFYLTAIATGMRRGELCALRWNDLHGGGAVLVQRSRSSVLGQGIVESSTKNHRARTVVIPDLVHDYMGELFLEQAREGRIIRPDDYIFSTAEGPAHPDSFTRRLRRLYQKNDFPAEYHCTPCGISSPPTCCKTIPANRWRLICWAMRTPAFWNAPTAIPSWRASSRRRSSWRACWNRQSKKPGSGNSAKRRV